MKVLFDTYAFRMQRVGGISRYFAELIRRLPSCGIEPQVFMPLVDNEHAASTGIANRHSTSLLARHGLGRRLVHSALQRTDALLRAAGQYRVLHQTYYAQPPRTRRRAACTIVDMIPDLFPQHFAGNPHQRKREVAAACDLVFSISECTTRDIVAVYGLDPGKIVTTQLGIDLAEFVSPASATNPFRAPYVLFVGQRGGYKNFQRLAAALVPVLAQWPELSLAVVGQPLSEEERRTFEASGVLGRVQQASVADLALPRIYGQAELFVFPSEYEGFGIPLLEAFAAGCPVAASRASCFPEVGGEAIEYFDPRSVDDIAHAATRILASRARADALRALGAERVKMFSWTRTAEKTAEAYRRLG
ncbi:MAG TPA: glycosyltransferase family 1 protein [Polyangia bacterium]|nr:glycosyltransferase family 1 protein [Polyangia bacterium]